MILSVFLFSEIQRCVINITSALQTLTRNLKQFRSSKINYNARTHFASLWGRESYEHAFLVFTLNFESRALLNILHCRSPSILVVCTCRAVFLSRQDARVREPGLLLVHKMIVRRGKLCTMHAPQLI